MAADLDLPVEVLACPLVRESDGLALSSRNAYLAPADRAAAPVLFRALRAATESVIAGERDAHVLDVRIREVVATEPAVELEYVEVRDAASIAPVERVDGAVLIALAARLGGTRLIDNVGITVDGGTVGVDLGTLSEGAKPVAPSPPAS